MSFTDEKTETQIAEGMSLSSGQVQVRTQPDNKVGFRTSVCLWHSSGLGTKKRGGPGNREGQTSRGPAPTRRARSIVLESGGPGPLGRDAE